MNIISLLLLLSFAAVGAILYTPALPSLVEELGISRGQAQATVMFFLAGYAFGQLPYGPLQNGLGRKRSVYLGSALAVIGCLLCALADSFWLLSVGRIIASLGMAVGLVATFTIVGDLYSRREGQRIISYLVLSFAVLPAIGVAIGGFLTEYLGWRSCFYFLVGYSFLIAYLTSRLPTTGPTPDLGHMRMSKMFQGIWHELRDPLVVLGGIFVGLGTVIVYVFAAEAPFIGIKELGLSADQFGLYNLIAYAGFAVGSVISARLPETISIRWRLFGGLSLTFSFALLMVILFALGWVNRWTLFLPTSGLFLAWPTIFSAVTSWIMSSATDKANASSLMSFLNMFVPALGVLLVSYGLPKSLLAMPLLFLVAAILMLGIATYLVRHKAA